MNKRCNNCKFGPIPCFNCFVVCPNRKKLGFCRCEKCKELAEDNHD